MNSVGLTTVGRLLAHRQRETTAIYAHLDDGSLRDAAAQAAGVIARAMGYRAEPPRLPDETVDDGDGTERNQPGNAESRVKPIDLLETPEATATESRPGRPDGAEPDGSAGELPRRPGADWLQPYP